MQSNDMYSPFKFELIQTVPNLPNEDQAEDILNYLANDEGILAVMQKYQWTVGVLCELHETPEEYGNACVLGLNYNQGERICLRLRTDDLQGFLSIQSIRETLCHELAHNVHNDHDVHFFNLMNQIARDMIELAPQNIEDSQSLQTMEAVLAEVGRKHEEVHREQQRRAIVLTTRRNALASEKAAITRLVGRKQRLLQRADQLQRHKEEQLREMIAHLNELMHRKTVVRCDVDCGAYQTTIGKVLKAIKQVQSEIASAEQQMTQRTQIFTQLRRRLQAAIGLQQEAQRTATAYAALTRDLRETQLRWQTTIQRAVELQVLPRRQSQRKRSWNMDNSPIERVVVKDEFPTQQDLPPSQEGQANAWSQRLLATRRELWNAEQLLIDSNAGVASRWELEDAAVAVTTQLRTIAAELRCLREDLRPFKQRPQWRPRFQHLVAMLIETERDLQRIYTHAASLGALRSTTNTAATATAGATAGNATVK